MNRTLSLEARVMAARELLEHRDEEEYEDATASQKADLCEALVFLDRLQNSFDQAKLHETSLGRRG